MSMKHEIAGLEKMTVGQLQARYAEVFGEPARSGNRQWLFRRVAWRIQMLAEGDLSERARERARDLVRDADLRVRPPRGAEHAALAAQPQPVGQLRTLSGRLSLNRDPRVPPAGSVIPRVFKGHEYRVIVLPHGFEYDGQGHQRHGHVQFRGRLGPRHRWRCRRAHGHRHGGDGQEHQATAGCQRGQRIAIRLIPIPRKEVIARAG